MDASYELESYEVKDLPGLLKPYLGDRKIENVEFKKLPQGGFGSVMIKMKIALTDGETVNAVAKVLPPSEHIRTMFKIEKTYFNELQFYKTIVPVLNEFRRESGGLGPMKGIAKFLGGRMTLKEDSSEDIDDDAVLVLEDLGVSGYSNRGNGIFFDLESSELILGHLAELQGTAIALKLLRPKVFEDIFKTKYRQYIFEGPVGPHVLAPLVRNLLARDERCRPYVENKTTMWDPANIPVTREPYGTITQNDLWVNNTMQHTANGRIVGNKIVDFQLLSYGSAITDVFFFIWTSVEVDVVKLKLDHLLQYYHEKLVETIGSLGCDTSVFTYDKFLDDVKHICEYEFGHASAFAFATREVFATRGLPNERKPEEGKPEKKTEGKSRLEELEKSASQDIQEFLWYMLMECVKRGWISKP